MSDVIALPPPPASYHPDNEMWLDEQILGHRLWDGQDPWLMFLEFLSVAEACHADGSLLKAGDFPFSYRPAQRIYLRNLLYNNEKLAEIAERYADDAAAWREWLEDLAFYDAHRTELKEDRRLKSAWDRFVFGRPIESTAFLAAAMEPLFNRMPAGSERKLWVRYESATRRDLRNLNVEAGLYFAHRYAGLRRQFGTQVAWEVGELFGYKGLVEGWRTNPRVKLNVSTAKPALQLKFLVELKTKTPTGATQTSSSQLVWRYEPTSITTEFVDDWTRIARNPFVACRTSREFAGDKSIDLLNVKTFMPAYDRDRGSFVPVYRREKDLAIAWRGNLQACVANGYISSENARRLDAVFAAFENAYTKALREFPENGGGVPVNLDQFRTYAALLDSVVNLAKGDRNREQLLKPLLEIGVVPIDGGPAAAVVAPWHPMRLAAISRKTRLTVDLIHQILQMREPEETSGAKSCFAT
jgi:DNA segregation ATPase FtsK/SpoIIIE, S-DNA-T family